MSEITQADWMLAANVMGFDSTEALRRHGHLRALHKQWAERLAAHRSTPSQRLDAATVERMREALRRSAEGWSNAIEMGLLPPQHHHSARILADECNAALATEPHQQENDQ